MIDGIVGRIHVPIQLDWIAVQHARRVLAQETPHPRIVVARPQAVQSREFIELLAGIQVAVLPRTGLRVHLAESGVGVGVADRAARIGQGSVDFKSKDGE